MMLVVGVSEAGGDGGAGTENVVMIDVVVSSQVALASCLLAGAAPEVIRM